MAVARRPTATAISSQVFVAQTTNLGSDHLCFELDALVGARWHIASHNARDIARTALDAFGGATLGGYGSRRPANGVAAHRDAHAYLATLHRARRYPTGSAEDADYGDCPNDGATPRGPNGETAGGTQIAGAHRKSPRVVRSPGVAGPDPWRAHAAKGLTPGLIAGQRDFWRPARSTWPATLREPQPRVIGEPERWRFAGHPRPVWRLLRERGPPSNNPAPRLAFAGR